MRLTNRYHIGRIKECAYLDLVINRPCLALPKSPLSMAFSSSFKCILETLSCEVPSMVKATHLVH